MRARGMIGLLLLAHAPAAADGEPPAADEEPPAVDEIVRQAVAVMERKPPRWVCRLSTRVETLALSGKLEDEFQIESEHTLEGGRRDDRVLSAVKNGKDITADVVAKQKDAKKKRKADGEQELLDPFSAKGRPAYGYELLRRDVLWKRPVWVLRVKARDRKPTAGDGTAWIDAETFVELKGEYVPAQLDEHLYWLKFQTQYALHPSGFVQPTFFKVEGAGHYFLIKKGFRSTIRWVGCR